MLVVEEDISLMSAVVVFFISMSSVTLWILDVTICNGGGTILGIYTLRSGPAILVFRLSTPVVYFAGISA